MIISRQGAKRQPRNPVPQRRALLQIGTPDPHRIDTCMSLPRTDLAELELAELEAALEARRRRAVSRPADLPLDPPARRHRLRRDDRPRRRRCAPALAPSSRPDDAARSSRDDRSIDGTGSSSSSSPTAAASSRCSSPTRRRMTFCISTQVGCAMACALLPDRQDGARPQSHGGRDRRPGARARRARSASSTSRSTSC